MLEVCRPPSPSTLILVYEEYGEEYIVHPVMTSGVKASVVQILICLFAQMYSALLTENASRVPQNGR